MLRNCFSLGLVAWAASAFFGCATDSQDDTPQPILCFGPPHCYAGTVVGSTCMDGLLIKVDPAYAIGAPALVWQAGRDTLRNVIAVVNSPDLRRCATPGQRVYFTYVNDPARQQLEGATCLAFDGVTTPIPRLVLSNVSTTPCQPATQRIQ